MLSEKFFLPKALIWMTRVVWCAKCRIPFYKVCKEMFQKLIYGFSCIFTRSYRVFYMRLAWIWLVSNFSYISTIWDAVWHCLYNFKNEKNTCGGVLLSKSKLLHGCIHVFQIVQMIPNRTKHIFNSTLSCIRG